MSHEPPRLETPRLLLRAMRMDDAPDFYEYARDPEVARFTTWSAHGSMDETRGFLKFAIERGATHEHIAWGIEDKQSARFIGTIGFHAIRTMHARGELGYALARPFWNRGLMSEAARAVLDYGFHSLRLNRIEAYCLPENIGSARVMEKIGMRYEGTLRQHAYVKGAFVDLKLYAMLKCDNQVM